jgi:ribosomal protein S18 acetylase RimI-like enzyme
MSEVKNFTPMDLALLRRVAARGLYLDITASIGNTHPLETAMLNMVGLKGLGRPTFILRTEHTAYASQMRLEDHHAHVTLLAPKPRQNGSPHPWLSLIDHMVWQAGRRGAYLISAEVPVDSAGFELFRKAGFTIYSRENVYVLEKPTSARQIISEDRRLVIRNIEEGDTLRLSALYSSTVPQMVQQVAPCPQDWHGLALLLDHRLMGCLMVHSQKRGLLLQPILHPELYDLAPQVLASALKMLPERKIYIRLHAYEEWLRRTLETDFGFEEIARYALMGRHTVVKTETHTFSPLAVLEHVALVPGGEIVALEIVSSEE